MRFSGCLSLPALFPARPIEHLDSAPFPPLNCSSNRRIQGVPTLGTFDVIVPSPHFGCRIQASQHIPRSLFSFVHLLSAMCRLARTLHDFPHRWCHPRPPRKTGAMAVEERPNPISTKARRHGTLSRKTGRCRDVVEVIFN